MKNYKVKCAWDKSDIESIIEIEAESEKAARVIAYGICGDFPFIQGGHGDMPMPDYVINID